MYSEGWLHIPAPLWVLSLPWLLGSGRFPGLRLQGDLACEMANLFQGKWHLSFGGVLLDFQEG